MLVDLYYALYNSMSCMHVTLVLNKKFDSIDGHVNGCISQSSLAS